MKLTLILFAIVPLFAFAAQKKPDLRQRSKVLQENLPKEDERIPPESHAVQDRKHQLEAKGTRQFQEEDVRDRK